MRKDVLSIVIISLLALTIYVVANNKPLILASKFSGVLIDKNNQPIANAQITRKVTFAWKNIEFTDTASTDASGGFHFSEVSFKNLSARIIPHQPSVEIVLSLKTGDNNKEVWALAKKNYDLYGENLGNSEKTNIPRAFRIICHADETPSASRSFWGVCEMIDL